MKGLSAKVFRTYASITFQNQFDEGTTENGTMQETLSRNSHANSMVVILYYHRQVAPKTHDESMVKIRVRMATSFYMDSHVFLQPLAYSSVGSNTIA